MIPWLNIVGIGEEGLAGLSAAAHRVLGESSVVFGGARHLALASSLIGGRGCVWKTPLSEGITQVLAHRGQCVTVLASGDPFFFGVGSVLAPQVPPGEMVCFPNISSVSLACSRLAWALQDVRVVSLCGRLPETIRPYLQPGARLMVLSADGTTPRHLASELVRYGFGLSPVRVFEHLGGPKEHVHQGYAASVWHEVAALNLIAVDVVAGPEASILPMACGLDDSVFEHDGQLTKREIRAITLSSLAPRAGETLIDIGAGAGSIAIEWLLRDPSNKAFAVECNPERASRIVRNAQALGVPRLNIVTGGAPEILDRINIRPHAVFVGGGLTAPGLFPALRSLMRPGGRLVANAVTLEGEQILATEHRAYGGALTRIGIDRVDAVGRLHAFRPAMRVTHYATTLPGDAA